MKKKFDFKILIILILIIGLVGIIIAYINIGNSSSNYSNKTLVKNSSETSGENSIKSSSKISQSAEVSSALTENLELHATYYFSEIYVGENQQVSQGENILQYTNGQYLTAPYDCVITKISVPDSGNQCTNKHYIQISSINNLQISLKISEEKIDQISLGDEAEIEITALDKTFKGAVVNISSTASKGYFTVTIEFENDGNVKLGMTANVKL